MKRQTAITSAFLCIWTAFTGVSAAAPAPQRMGLPAPTFRLAGDSLVVPMESWQGRSVVRVLLDGHGPFPFVLDTGAQGSVIAKSLADSLRLPVEGEAQVGSPLGGQPVPAKVVRVGQLAVGQALEASFSCVAVELPMASPATYLGVLSPSQFPGLLVTWDFARQRIVFRRGSLPAPDGVQVFSYEGEPLPTVPVEVAGRVLRVHVDTGSSAGLMLPAALRDSLPLAGPPREGRTARTVDREMKLLDASLDGDIVVAGRTYAAPEIELNAAARIGNLGAKVLRDFEVTVDAQQRSIRLRPRGATGPGAGAPPPRPPPHAGAKPGAAELEAIAPGLPDAMIARAGVATAGLPHAEDFAAFARAGYRTVVDVCTPGEPRGYDEPEVVRAAGLEYMNIPFTRSTLGPEQIGAFRRVMADPAKRPVLVHCIAANRVGGILLPWLVLDEGLSEEQARALAEQIGLRSPEMLEAGLAYVKAERGRTK